MLSSLPRSTAHGHRRGNQLEHGAGTSSSVLALFDIIVTLVSLEGGAARPLLHPSAPVASFSRFATASSPLPPIIALADSSVPPPPQKEGPKKMTPRKERELLGTNTAHPVYSMSHEMIRPLLLDPSDVYDPLVLELLVQSPVFILPSTHLHFVPTYPRRRLLKNLVPPSITGRILISTHGSSLRIHPRSF